MPFSDVKHVLGICPVGCTVPFAEMVTGECMACPAKLSDSFSGSAPSGRRESSLPCFTAKSTGYVGALTASAEGSDAGVFAAVAYS